MAEDTDKTKTSDEARTLFREEVDAQKKPANENPIVKFLDPLGIGKLIASWVSSSTGGEEKKTEPDPVTPPPPDKFYHPERDKLYRPENENRENENLKLITTGVPKHAGVTPTVPPAPAAPAADAPLPPKQAYDDLRPHIISNIVPATEAKPATFETHEVEERRDDAHIADLTRQLNEAEKKYGTLEELQARKAKLEEEIANATHPKPADAKPSKEDADALAKIESDKAAAESNWKAMTAALQRDSLQSKDGFMVQVNGKDVRLDSLRQEEAADALKQDENQKRLTAELDQNPHTGAHEHYDAYVQLSQSAHAGQEKYDDAHKQPDLSLSLVKKNAATPESDPLQPKKDELREINNNINAINGLRQGLDAAQHPSPTKTTTETKPALEAQNAHFEWGYSSSDPMDKAAMQYIETAAHNAGVALPTDKASEKALIETVKKSKEFNAYADAVVATEEAKKAQKLDQAEHELDTKRLASTNADKALAEATKTPFGFTSPSPPAELLAAQEAVKASQKAVDATTKSGGQPLFQAQQGLKDAQKHFDELGGEKAVRSYENAAQAYDNVRDLAGRHPEEMKETVKLIAQYKNEHGDQVPTAKQLFDYAYEKHNDAVELIAANLKEDKSVQLIDKNNADIAHYCDNVAKLKKESTGASGDFLKKYNEVEEMRKTAGPRKYYPEGADKAVTDLQKAEEDAKGKFTASLEDPNGALQAKLKEPKVVADDSKGKDQPPHLKEARDAVPPDGHGIKGGDHVADHELPTGAPPPPGKKPPEKSGLTPP